MLYALQRVVAALGYCDPPVRTGYNHAPDIDGADPAWTACVERWHGTSTPTPKERATIRTIMSKTGGWPSSTPRSPSPLGGRVGEPISPRARADPITDGRRRGRRRGV
jgi:hypothetical protein